MAQLITDYLAKKSKTANALIEVRAGVLRYIKRNHTQAATRIESHKILSSKIGKAQQIKALESKFSINIPYPDSFTLETEEKTVRVENASFGQVVNYDALSNVEQEQINFLSNILAIEKLPVCTVVVDHISDRQIGDKIIAYNDKQRADIGMLIDNIVYDFENNQTTFSGHSTLTYKQ